MKTAERKALEKKYKATIKNMEKNFEKLNSGIRSSIKYDGVIAGYEVLLDELAHTKESMSLKAFADRMNELQWFICEDHVIGEAFYDDETPNDQWKTDLYYVALCDTMEDEATEILKGLGEI